MHIDDVTDMTPFVIVFTRLKQVSLGEKSYKFKLKLK